MKRADIVKTIVTTKTVEIERNLFLFSLKAFLICFTLIILLPLTTLYLLENDEVETEIVQESVEKDYDSYKIIYNLKEEEEEEIVSKIEEEIEELPKKMLRFWRVTGKRLMNILMLFSFLYIS